jgi:tetratricopeptide (TPR) repeat protein
VDNISQITSPDLFIKLCKQLLAAEYKDFQTIDDSGGDSGNDGYSAAEEMLIQIYCPEKPQKASDADYKGKIKEDLNKAKNLADNKGYKIKEWVFITPQELREPVQTYIRDEAQARGFIGMAWASPKLAEFLAKHSHLRSQFPDLISGDIEKQVDISTAKIIDHLDTVDEVEKRFRTNLEQRYQKRIDEAKKKMDLQLGEAKKEYEQIVADLASETESIDPHIRFRAFNNLGSCELNLGNTSKAADLFEKGYAAEPEFPMAIANFALSKMLRDLPSEGLALIDTFLKKHPDDEHGISVKANILYAMEKDRELMTFLRSKRKIALIHWYQGRNQTNSKDYEGAIASFESVLKLEPKNFIAMMFLAQNVMTGMKEVARDNPFPPDKVPLEIKTKFLRAIECLNEAIRLLKDRDDKANLEMAYANLSGCYVAIGMHEESKKAAAEAISIDSTSAIAFLNKGIAELKLNDFKAALHSFNTYKELGGEDAEVDRHIAYCALRTGDLVSAQKLIEAHIGKGKGTNLDLAELAVDLYSRKLDNEKLNPLLDTLEKDFTDNAQALRVRALYMMRRGLEGAEALMKKSLHNATSNVDKMLAEVDIADMLYDQQDYEAASQLYKKYIDLQDGNRPTFRYAECLYSSGQYGALIEWIATLGPAVKEKTSIKEAEAYANLYLGNLEHASRLFKGLFEKNPNKIQYLVYYGMCRFRLGKEVDAKNAYDAIRNRVETTQDLMILAGGYQVIGEWDAAMELAFKALESDDNNPKAHFGFIATFIKKEQAQGDDFKEEHIKAFQKSMAEFNTRFPEEKGLQGFEAKEGDISGILKAVDQMAERTDNATNLYKESKAPMAFIPRLTGKKPFDVWAAFTQMPDVGIRMCFGAPDEAPMEIATIDGARGGSIVVDIYPLFLLGHFDRLDLLPKLFKKIYVHQSVLDELGEVIEDRKVSMRKGQTILGKVNGQHRMDEISPEQIKKTLDLLEKIRNFLTAEKNVEVRGFAKEKAKEEESIVNALHESTRDSVLLAEELKIPLYCDDCILRAVLQRDSSISSFSSQSIFFAAHKDGDLTLEQRYELQKGMSDFNYSFLSIDAPFIYSQLKKEGYDAEKIRKIILMLVAKETNIQSLSMVLADLFFVLMADKSINGNAKLKATTYILKEAAPNHDLAKLEEGMFMNLQNRVQPEKHAELRDMIKLIFLKASIGQ